jgi:hypothetical protein
MIDDRWKIDEIPTLRITASHTGEEKKYSSPDCSISRCEIEIQPPKHAIDVKIFPKFLSLVDPFVSHP